MGPKEEGGAAEVVYLYGILEVTVFEAEHLHNAIHGRIMEATEKLQETMGVHCLQHSRLYVDVDVGAARVARTREVEFHPTSPAWNQSFRLHCAYPAAAVTFTLHRQEPAPRRRGRPRRRLRARRARRLGAAGRVLARPPRRRARPRDALLARAGEPPRPHLRARQAHDRGRRVRHRRLGKPERAIAGRQPGQRDRAGELPAGAPERAVRARGGGGGGGGRCTGSGCRCGTSTSWRATPARAVAMMTGPCSWSPRAWSACGRCGGSRSGCGARTRRTGWRTCRATCCRSR
ncbi:hypothetical protein PVAP13_2NG336012 [Panicum virgatum]|uniref:C2 domain-containing protein n=1 Tax=Panicum virgatum TaxID=38727 RepID=A0A8T0VFM8_PANVG|nr:hypothetical protein PVAP13_2NG336012 [Panicum virgatum]